MLSVSQNHSSSPRTRTPVKLHPRLEQLNRELASEKSYDYLYANHGGLKVRVCVFRNEDYKFFATTSVGRYSFREQGSSPSGAFRMLGIAVRVHIATLPSAERQKLIQGGK